MKKSIKLFTTVMVCMAMALCVSCKKDDNNNNPGGGTQTVATVTTNEVTEITQTTAICGGEVKSENGWAVTERGVCWSTEPNPTPSDNCTVDGEGIGKFTSEMTGLEPGTKYYVRAYAKNAAGTGFGAERRFTTLENGGGGGGTQTVATVTTNEVTEITQTTAICGGEVKSENGWAVTERGVCWSTEPNPTPSDNCTVDGEGIGKFTSVITGLIPGTKYYVRAYAKNAAGTGFGAERSFTTLENGGGGGRFSVSSTTTVEFAPGNLYWDGSAFRFEANQWDYSVGDFSHYDEAGNIVYNWDPSHVSHFFWSNTTDWQTSGKEPYASSYSYSTLTSSDVFFTEASGFQVSAETEGGTWRTLSTGEWSYLLNTYGASSGARTDVNRFAKAMVNGVKGLLIFPDGYNGTAISGITGIATVNSTGAPYPSESIPTGTWASMESAGVVFLPAAGYRGGTSLYGVGSYGYYWSSSCNSSYHAYGMYFGSGDVHPQDTNSRYSGFSVRLVR